MTHDAFRVGFLEDSTGFEDIVGVVDVQARDDGFLESEGCDLDFFHDGVRVSEDG